MGAVSQDALDQLFIEARTHNGWSETPVPVEMLKKIWDLTKWGPTSANCSPARIIFVASQEAKERLKPFLIEGNVDMDVNQALSPEELEKAYILTCQSHPISDKVIVDYDQL